eukprot:scaffold24242_cov66-Phaeocystis_antarctica.AAC.5
MVPPAAPPPAPPPPSPPPPPPPPAPPLSSLLKLSATPTLSSVLGDYIASYCVDGDLNNFCHSDESSLSDPSLTLDLGTATQIAYVAVYNRRSCCQSRLGDYTVSYRARSTDAWTICADATAAADAIGPLLSECPHMARYVMIKLPGSTPYKVGDPGRILNLGEVEVYTYAKAKPNYTLMSDALSWHDADAACQAAGLQLASVHSAAQNALLVAAAAGNRVWIGGTDAASEGTWVWSPSNTPLSYTNWATGQPAGQRSENCVKVYSADNDGPGQWHDYPCDGPYPGFYVCQQPN